jgi:flagellar basal-body rod modification protein FlgD
MTTSSINPATATSTSRGTKIVKADGGMDKDAFLRILTAELSNQDPTNAKDDSTEYVAQMAQFSSLEQMANLNTTLTMSSVNAMIGKTVTLTDLDSNGDPYSGIARVVARDGSDVTVGVEVTENGTTDIKEFNYADINGVYNNANETTNISSNTLNLLAASNMIGKSGEFSDKDADGNNLTGLITGIVKTAAGFDLKVLLDKTGETKELSADNMLSLSSESTK